MRSQRIDTMIAYIKEQKTVTLDQLCKEFDVSKNTIRRDIPEILASGEFKKIYGGITFASQSSLKPFSERSIRNQTLKQRIARKAATFVNDGDIIFIDSGSTTFHMIEHLKDKKNITVLTNNLEAIIHAMHYPEINIVSLSGNLNHKTLSFTGPSAAPVLSNYNISKSFMASTGISAESGATNSSPLEHELKHTAVSRSQINYLLVDHTKFNVVSLLTFSNFDSIDAVITDEMPPTDLADHLRTNNTDIVLC